MTVSLIKIKVFPKPLLKGKMDVRFPARVLASAPLLLDASGGIYTFSLDMNALVSALSAVFVPAGVDQEILAGATANVATNASTVRVNKTVGGAITLTLPAAISKTCPVLIADWKNDAGTNNITINPTGSEKIQGLSSWTIAGDGGSIFLRPIPGVGYAI